MIFKPEFSGSTGFDVDCATKGSKAVSKNAGHLGQGLFIVPIGRYFAKDFQDK